MNADKKKLISKVQIITFIILILFITIIIYLNSTEVIKLQSRIAFIILGLTLISSGVFGLINNEISIGNAKSLEYSSGSIVGQIEQYFNFDYRINWASNRSN